MPTVKKTLVLIGLMLAYQAIMLAYGQPWWAARSPHRDFLSPTGTVNPSGVRALSKGLPGGPTLRSADRGRPPGTSLDKWAFDPFFHLLDRTRAVKIASLVYLGLAGASMFLLCHSFTGKFLLSFCGGLLYMLSPAFIATLAPAGEYTATVFYAVQPLGFLALWRLLERPSGRRLAASAMVIVLATGLDVERALTSLPFLAVTVLFGRVFCEVKHNGRPSWASLLKSTAWLAGAAVPAVLLSLVLLRPVNGQTGEGALQATQNTLGAVNPWSILDRNDWLWRRLAEYLPSYDMGTDRYYLGLVLASVLGTVFLARHRKDSRIRFAEVALIVCLICLWAAGGPVSIWQHLSSQGVYLYRNLRYTNEHPYLLPGLALTMLVMIAGLIWWRHTSGCEPWSATRMTLAAGFVLLVTCTTLFPWLRRLPVYSHLRGPGPFITTAPPLLLVLAAVRLGEYWTQRLRPGWRVLVILIVTGLVLSDVAVYRDRFRGSPSHQELGDPAATSCVGARYTSCLLSESCNRAPTQGCLKERISNLTFRPHGSTS